MGGSVAIAHGARAAETALLDEVLALAGSHALAAPIRVIVPSRSLREHLCTQWVIRSRGAIAGVVVQTLHTLIASILDRARCKPAASALFGVHIRELARREASLFSALDGLRDGYAAVEAVVADLLDAGFEPAHAEALAEQIAEITTGVARERALALVRIATEAAIADTGVAHGSADIVRARDCLERDPDWMLPSSAIFVVGFADATGVQTDLFETLIRRCDAKVAIDWPLDPSEPERLDADVLFTQRFAARLSAAAGRVLDPAMEPGGSLERRSALGLIPTILHAPGRAAEVREVANRIRCSLDAGARPESIGVVARSLDGYRALLREHFGRLGVPFSGIDESTAATAARRRHTALFALLRDGEQTSLDRWLDALVVLPGGSGSLRADLTMRDRADLRVMLRGHGLTRVGQLSDASFPVGRPLLRAVARLAQGLRAHRAAWPARASVADHRHALFELVRDHLGWPSDASASEELDVAAGDFDAPTDVVIERSDFVQLVERRLFAAGSVPIGGSGGGVAVLSAMEARARTFEHLFVIGLSRNVFPRPISEDPLLPDSIRAQLRSVLPDLPVKRDGVDEDRYLFAQLLSASPDVVLSCPTADEDGRPIPISPLFERLHATASVEVRGLWSTARGAPRPAHEHAMLAGLHGTREQFSHALRAAVSEMGSQSRYAAARVAVLAEADPRGERRNQLGPYFGLVGSPSDKADPRMAPLSVTTLEGIAACPWQRFVGRYLKVGSDPDARGELPTADKRWLGSLVHRVLQRVAVEGLHAAGARDVADDLAVVLRGAPVAVRWPDATQLESWLVEAAEEVVAEEGVRTPGFAHVLVEGVRDQIEVARANWPATPTLLGAEVDGVVHVLDATGSRREIRFRADRVEAGPVLIDYKTGSVFANQKGEPFRSAKLLDRMLHGSSLQAAAYALAAAELGEPNAEGRFLFLKPDVEDHARALTVNANDEGFTTAFSQTASAVFDVIDHGGFVPRLVDPNKDTEPRRCSYCDVKEACIRGDSVARRRLQSWAELAGKRVDALTSAERALLAMWRIGEDRT